MTLPFQNASTVPISGTFSAGPAGVTYWVTCKSCNGTGFVSKCETYDYGGGLGGGSYTSMQCIACKGAGTVQVTDIEAYYSPPLPTDPLTGVLDHENRLRTLETLVGQLRLQNGLFEERLRALEKPAPVIPFHDNDEPGMDH